MAEKTEKTAEKAAEKNPTPPVDPAAELAALRQQLAEQQARAAEAEAKLKAQESAQFTELKTDDGRSDEARSLSRAIASLADETGKSGHELLAKVTEMEPKDPVCVAAHHLAFAANTGLAPRAVAGLAEMSHDDLAALLLANRGKSQEAITAIARKRWPEPPRAAPAV